MWYNATNEEGNTNGLTNMLQLDRLPLIKAKKKPSLRY